jgi:membrane protein
LKRDARGSPESVADGATPGEASSTPPGPANEAQKVRPATQPVANQPSRFQAFLEVAGDYVVRTYRQADEDGIFFLAGAIAFKVVIAIVPLILAMLGVAGLLLQSRFGPRAADQVLNYAFQALPALDPELISLIRQALNDLLEGATGFVGVGTLVLIWLSTGLVGTLRTALREIFDIQNDRGIIGGKLFDMGMVIASGTLLAINVGISVLLQIAGSFSRGLLGIDAARFDTFYNILLNVVAFVSIWFMFVLIYRYLPARRPHWRIAMIAATFTGVLFELMKTAFGWYVTNVASYNTTYGNFATVIIVLLWIYYMSVAFIIGGEVGQVAAVRRTRKRQKERLN